MLRFPGWEIAAPVQGKGLGAQSPVPSPGSCDPAGKVPGAPRGAGTLCPRVSISLTPGHLCPQLLPPPAFLPAGYFEDK